MTQNIQIKSQPRTITLVIKQQKDKDFEIIFSQHLKKFSHLILFFNQQLISSQQNIQTFNTTYVLPQLARISSFSLRFLKQFLEFHQYDPLLITPKSINSINKLTKSNTFQTKTAQFVNKYCIQNILNDQLQKIDNNSISTNHIKQILSMCQYLQIDSLKIVILYYLQVKYNPGVTKQILIQKLNNFNVKKFKNIDVINMKRKYLDYFISRGVEQYQKIQQANINKNQTN